MQEYSVCGIPAPLLYFYNINLLRFFWLFPFICDHIKIERQAEKDKQRKTYRESQAEKDKQRKTCRERHAEKDKQRKTSRERHAEKDRQIKIEKEADKKTYR